MKLCTYYLDFWKGIHLLAFFCFTVDAGFYSLSSFFASQDMGNTAVCKRPFIPGHGQPTIVMFSSKKAELPCRK